MSLRIVPLFLLRYYSVSRRPASCCVNWNTRRDAKRQWPLLQPSGMEHRYWVLFGRKLITKGNQLYRHLFFRLRSTKPPLAFANTLHSWFREQWHGFSFLNLLLLISVLQLSLFPFTLCLSLSFLSSFFLIFVCCCLASSPNPCRLAGKCGVWRRRFRINGLCLPFGQHGWEWRYLTSRLVRSVGWNCVV